jgi:hypothetical protein
MLGFWRFYRTFRHCVRRTTARLFRGQYESLACMSFFGICCEGLRRLIRLSRRFKGVRAFTFGGLLGSQEDGRNLDKDEDHQRSVDVHPVDG